jgi:RHS repeat-associated protein
MDKGEKISYTYTGDGLMATRRTRSKTTSYSWDTSSDLGQLALETNSKGKNKGTQAYTYGAGPIGIITSAGSYSFHTDALGSVVELSDSSGRSVESYRYAAFGDAYAPGNSDQSSGNFSNPIRFTGQYLDTVSDLYNMRAREYEPETGRFLQVDPQEAGAGDPAVGAYVYVGDQPTVMTDPSGEKALTAAYGSTASATAEESNAGIHTLCMSLRTSGPSWGKANPSHICGFGINSSDTPSFATGKEGIASIYYPNANGRPSLGQIWIKMSGAMGGGMLYIGSDKKRAWNSYVGRRPFPWVTSASHGVFKLSFRTLFANSYVKTYITIGIWAPWGCNFKTKWIY